MAHRDRNISMFRGTGFLALFALLAAVCATSLTRADNKVAGHANTSSAANSPAAAEDKEKAASKKKDEKAGEKAKAGEAKPQLTRRDPFVVPVRIKFEPPKVEIKKEPKPITPPGMEMRLTEYRNLVRAASVNGQVTPDKLSPYLIEDFTVTGIFRDSGGYGAFMLAGPTKLTFFARVGMRTYDGVVKDITPTGVRFVKNVRYDDGSVRQTEVFQALRSGK